MHMYVKTDRYIYIYMHIIYIHTYIYIYIYEYVRYIHIYIHIYTYFYTCIYTYISHKNKFAGKNIDHSIASISFHGGHILVKKKRANEVSL